MVEIVQKPEPEVRLVERQINIGLINEKLNYLIDLTNSIWAKINIQK